MSLFKCLCGEVTREADEPRDASGVVHSIADMQEAEHRIAALIESLLATHDRAEWVESHFDFPYPLDVTNRALIDDIVSRELYVKFASIFRCPRCGRIAIKNCDVTKWEFYKRESHADI